MRFPILLFFFFFSHLIVGQKNYILEFEGDTHLAVKKNPDGKFKDSLSLTQYLRSFQSTARTDGYLLADFQQIEWMNKTCRVRFFLGPQFEGLIVQTEESVKQELKQYIGANEKWLLQQKMQPREISRMIEKIEKGYLNNGYPFVKIRLNIQSVNPKSTIALLSIEKGIQLRWTEVHLKGDSAVSKSFLSSLLDIKVGDLYSEERREQITIKLKQVPFLKELKPHEVLFTASGTELFLYVESVPISSINGFLGLQPKPLNAGYAFTGDIALKLQNVVKRGELLELNWRNLQGQTQQLKTRLNAPFLFGSPFGIDGQFNLYKRDSTFLELKSNLAVQYFLKGGNYVSFFYQRLNSSVLKAGQNSTVYTNLANVTSNNYGIGFNRQALDYLPNPSKGVKWSVSMAVGQRTSQVNDSLPQIKSTQYRGESELDWYIPITKRNVIRLGNKTQFLNTDPLFQNELFRFGGLLHQRGFNEDELFASTLVTNTIEYRFLVDQDSRAFVFYDITWYENRAVEYRNDAPYGFGAGFAFGTEIGTFSILYALGSQQNNPILLRNGKVHFGYIAYF